MKTRSFFHVGTFFFCRIMSILFLLLVPLVIPMTAASMCDPPCVPGEESLMSIKQHGTSQTPVQNPLRWNCDAQVADRICNYNRRYAEYAGYWEETELLEKVSSAITAGTCGFVEFFDSNTGKKLFSVPYHRQCDDGQTFGRSFHDFVEESRVHGWPSFRNDEVNWENVRVLPNGETVSVDGTHLGHNLPDEQGNRFCINVVCIAGNAVMEDA